MNRTLVAVALLALVGACTPKPKSDGSTLTEAQRDSVLSRSGLPGTSAIGRAMSTADAESRRAAELKAQVDSLPH